MSPKDRFIRSDFAALHAQVTSHPQFEHFLDTALLQMQYILNSNTETGTAAAAHLQMVGAQRFREIFMGLSKPVEVPKMTKRENLIPTN